MISIHGYSFYFLCNNSHIRNGRKKKRWKMFPSGGNEKKKNKLSVVEKRAVEKKHTHTRIGPLWPAVRLYLFSGFQHIHILLSSCIKYTFLYIYLRFSNSRRSTSCHTTWHTLARNQFHNPHFDFSYIHAT